MRLRISALLLVLAIVAVPSAQAWTFLGQWHDDLDLGVVQTHPLGVNGGCNLYANCQELRGTSLMDYDVSDTLDNAKADEDNLWVFLYGRSAQKSVTYWRVCGYDADFQFLNCITGKGDLQGFLNKNTEHIRVMLYDGAAAGYSLYLYSR